MTNAAVAGALWWMMGEVEEREWHMGGAQKYVNKEHEDGDS